MKKASLCGSFGPLGKTLLTAAAATVALAGCAGGGVVPDPRAPGSVEGSPVLLRVCRVDDGGAHLSVGDQVEFSTGGRGKLTIRHIPGPNNKDGLWNGGEAVPVRAAILVELVAPRANQKNTRRFVPVGRFSVRVSDSAEHAQFDFLASKVTERLRIEQYPECDADVGDDEVLVRGVPDQARHGGTVHLQD